MNMILGLGKSSPFIQQWVKQTLNIGGRLKCSRRDTAQVIGKVVQATKGHLIEMMAWSGLQRMSKLQLTKRNNGGHICLYRGEP